jgi:hypothetical protein
LPLILVAGVALLSSGCKTLSLKADKKEEPPAEAKAAPETPAMKIPIGTVHLVDTAGNFVLIRSSRMLMIEPDTLITVFDDRGEIAATLKVSPARKGSFLTADILSGIPKTGQQAVMDYDPAKRSDPASAGGTGQGAASDIQVLE